LKRTLLLLTLVGAVLLACSGVVLAQQDRTAPDTALQDDTVKEASTDKIPNRYIVLLEDSVSDPGAVADEHRRAAGLERIDHVYRYAVKGYSAVVPNEQSLNRLRNQDGVRSVEQDSEVSEARQRTPWGINKIEAPKSATWQTRPVSISDVHTYIIDSGVDHTDTTRQHPDLNVARQVNPPNEDGGDGDCSGHGTHVAGTATANDNTIDVVGVAPGVARDSSTSSLLTGVKVLGCNGTGTVSGVIAGIDWVTGDVQNGTPDDTSDDKRPAVANMSLSGPQTDSLDVAVRNSAAVGILYAVAAGNNGGEACNYSPAAAGQGDNGIITVGSTDNRDKKASSSNSGSCVDLYAPGVKIPSTALGGGTTMASGTSMASPHVVGAAAFHLSAAGRSSDTPTQVETKLKSDAVTTREGLKRLKIDSTY
jgi:hypothetical protein